MRRALPIALLALSTLGAIATAAAVLVERPRWEAYDRADELVSKAQELSGRGDIRGAHAAVEEALAIAPDDPRARRENGLQLLAAGQREEALAELKAVAKALPYDAGAARELGVLLATMGDVKAGIGWLRKAVSLQPGNGIIHTLLAGYLLQAGQSQQAGREAELGAKLAPQVRLAQSSLGLARWKSGDREGAISAFNRTLALSPSDVPTLLCLAGVTGELHRRDEAIGYLQRALEIAPGNATGWTALGAAYLADNRRSEAERAFREALKLDLNEPGAKAGVQKLAEQQRRAGGER